MRTLPAFVVALLPTLLSACAEPSGSGAAPSATNEAAPPSSAASTATPTPSVKPAEPELAAPADLDVAAQKKALKCGGDAKSGPCAVLQAFGTCVAWNPVVPSGDGRWIGRGYRVEGGKTTEEVTLLRARRVPSNETAPGQLPAKIAVTDLAKEEGQAFAQADKLINTLKRSDVPAKSNMALEHLKKREAWPEGFSMKTTGGQVYVLSQGGTFVCQGPKRELYVVQRAATRGSQGDGLYAEVWSATW